MPFITEICDKLFLRVILICSGLGYRVQALIRMNLVNRLTETEGLIENQEK